MGGVHGQRRGFDQGRAAERRLDDPLGRVQPGPAHLQRGVREHAAVEPGRQAPGVSLLPRRSPGRGPGLGARPRGGRGPARERPARAASPTSPGPPTGGEWRSSPATPTPTPFPRARTAASIVPSRSSWTASRSRRTRSGTSAATRDHLYLFDLDKRNAILLTPGAYDEAHAGLVARRPVHRLREPPAAGLRPHDQLRHLRGAGGTPVRSRDSSPRIQGADNDPEWGTRAPTWSPDGRYLAYVQGGKPELIYYAVQQLAVVPVAGGPAKLLAPTLDRNVLSPVWSPDGSVALLPGRGRPGLPPRADSRRGRGGRADRDRQARDQRPLRLPQRQDRGRRGDDRPARRDLRGRRRRASQAEQPERRLARRGAAGSRRGDLGPQQGRHRDSRLHGEAARLSAGPPLSHDPPDPRRARSGSTTTISPTWIGRSSPRTAMSCWA